MALALAGIGADQEARETAESINDDEVREVVLAKITVRLAKAGYLQTAMKTHKLVLDLFLSAWALAMLAENLAASKDQARAFEMAERSHHIAQAIFGDRDRALVLAKVAATYAATGDRALAHSTAADTWSIIDSAAETDGPFLVHRCHGRPGRRRRDCARVDGCEVDP